MDDRMISTRPKHKLDRSSPIRSACKSGIRAQNSFKQQVPSGRKGGVHFGLSHVRVVFQNVMRSSLWLPIYVSKGQISFRSTWTRRVVLSGSTVRSG